MSEEFLTYKFMDLHFCYDARNSENVDGIQLQAKELIRLRELAKRVAEIAYLPIQEKRKEQWQKRNDLQLGKPMVAIDEVCWHEMNVNNELTLQTSTPFCKKLEAKMLQTLYQWEHMQADMVIEPVVYAPLAISSSGVGMRKDADIIQSDKNNDVVSHKYHVQIKDEEDIEKLKTPVIYHDLTQSELTCQIYRDIFDGILKVEQKGVPGFWFAPWDDIVMWAGVQEILLDLIMRPDYVHKLMTRMTEIAMHVLDEYERMELLAPNNYNVRVGSGAYGYTKELPSATNVPVKAKALWGNATPQIFASVGPDMHKEFALDYEKKWLDRFGLTYYGCCEPLHNKLDILSEIKNLRKISFSPWADLKIAAPVCSGKYVMSIKPSPTFLAQREWNPEAVRKDMMNILTIARKYDCCAELVIKDISTVQYQPQRLWEWTKIATELTNNYF